MAKVITEDMLDDIISSGPMNFFKHEMNVPVEVVFTSSITHTEPGEIDMFERVWNPPVTDAQGMPIIDKNTGKPREKWPKTEATCTINKAPNVYSFSAKSLLREFIKAMRDNEVSNEELPGTKWSINRVGQWNLVIKYLGREGEEEKSSSPTPIKEPNGDEIKNVLTNFKESNPKKVEDGLKRNQLIQYITFETDLKPTQVEGKLNSLIKSGFLSVKEDGLIFIN